MGSFKFLSRLHLYATSLLIILTSSFSYADMNMNSGQQCSKPDIGAAETDFKANLNTLLNSLAENGPLQNGFYTTSIGENKNQIFGLVQCRGDISETNCGSCIKNSSVFALSQCSESQDVAIWFTWCFLRYSTYDFIGILGQNSVAVLNETNYDDPSLVSNGLSLMNGLASFVPNQRFMFGTDVLEGGIRGRRFGMAQCTRDVSRVDCGMCLNSQLDAFRTTIGNKKDWEVYGLNCFMWYHDYQFYFNYTVSVSSGGRWGFSDCGRTSFIFFIVFMMLLMIV